MKKNKEKLAQQIWLAGLGAFALAEAEGNKLFGSLVKRGHGVEKLNKARFDKVFARIEKARDRVRENADRAISRIGNPFDAGMTAALHQFGVPTRREIVTLTKRVEELTRVVSRTKGKKAVRAHKAPAAITTG